MRIHCCVFQNVKEIEIHVSSLLKNCSTLKACLPIQLPLHMYIVCIEWIDYI